MNQAPDRFTATGLNTLDRIEQKLAVLSPEECGGNRTGDRAVASFA